VKDIAIVGINAKHLVPIVECNPEFAFRVHGHAVGKGLFFTQLKNYLTIRESPRFLIKIKRVNPAIRRITKIEDGTICVSRHTVGNGKLAQFFICSKCSI
jgi:hypothetical protein